MNNLSFANQSQVFIKSYIPTFDVPKARLYFPNLWNTNTKSHFLSPILSDTLVLALSKKSILLVFLGLLSFLFLRYISGTWKPKPRKLTLNLDAVQALSSVLTPTSVAWPLPYMKLFSKHTIRTGSASTRRSIDLDLDELLSHVCDGQLEVRDSQDLALLFQQRLSIYAWDLKITTHGRWFIKVADWIARQHFIESSAQITDQTLSTHDHWPLTYIPRKARPSFDLDFVPYHDLPTQILRIQELHRPGNVTTIEFSSLGPGVRLMTSDFLLCAAPLLLNDAVKELHTLTRKIRINRTSVPFFVQLNGIVGLLASQRTIKVKSATNVSSRHARLLYKLERDLIDNRNFRTQHIKDVGLTGWRKDRLALQWEAGLLSSKLLVRWRITFQ